MGQGTIQISEEEIEEVRAEFMECLRSKKVVYEPPAEKYQEIHVGMKSSMRSFYFLSVMRVALFTALLLDLGANTSTEVGTVLLRTLPAIAVLICLEVTQYKTVKHLYSMALTLQDSLIIAGDLIERAHLKNIIFFRKAAGPVIYAAGARLDDIAKLTQVNHTEAIDTIRDARKIIRTLVIKSNRLETAVRKCRRRKHLPPVTDPTDQRILELVMKDPDLTDQAIALKLQISRQAVNARRRGLEKMGYVVR